MSDRAQPRVTEYLARWRLGDRSAFDALVPLVEKELRRLARRCMRRERGHHTLQPTALVNEAWIRLAGERDMEWRDRAHFFAMAARLMRFILVDYARRRAAPKRGGDFRRVTFDEALALSNDECAAGLLDIDVALARLGSVDARKAEVATMRLFAGASVDETAHALGISGVTVMRDWRFARAWLHRELQDR